MAMARVRTGDNDHTIALELVSFILTPLISLSVLDKRRKWTKISEARRGISESDAELADRRWNLVRC